MNNEATIVSCCERALERSGQIHGARDQWRNYRSIEVALIGLEECDAIFVEEHSTTWVVRVNVAPVVVHSCNG
jgi:hypothetical protein